MIESVIRVLLHGYRWLLRLYPADHRHEYGDVMLDAARSLYEEAAERRGWAGVADVTLRLLADTAANAPREVITHYKEHLMPFMDYWRQRPGQLLLGAAALLLCIVSLPLLGTLQIIGFGPIPLVLCIWWLRQQPSDIPPAVQIGLFVLGGIIPLLWVISRLLTAPRIMPLELLVVWVVSFGFGGVLLGAVLLTRSLAGRLRLPHLPLSAVLLALMARYAELDYFTFQVGYVIRWLPLVAVPVIVLWALLARDRRWRTAGILSIWGLTLVAIVAVNVYGRQVLGGMEYVAFNVWWYALASLTSLWIGASLPEVPPHEQADMMQKGAVST